MKPQDGASQRRCPRHVWLGVSAPHGCVTNYPPNLAAPSSICYLTVLVVRTLGAAQLDLLLQGQSQAVVQCGPGLPSHLRAQWGRTHSQPLAGFRALRTIRRRASIPGWRLAGCPPQFLAIWPSPTWPLTTCFIKVSRARRQESAVEEEPAPFRQTSRGTCHVFCHTLLVRGQWCWAAPIVPAPCTSASWSGGGDPSESALS